MYGAHSFYFARIEFKFGSHDRWVILWAWLMVQNAKFIISRFLVVIFLEIQMLRLANLQNNYTFLYEMLFFSAKNLQLVQTVVFR